MHNTVQNYCCLFLSTFERETSRYESGKKYRNNSSFHTQEIIMQDAIIIKEEYLHFFSRLNWCKINQIII